MRGKTASEKLSVVYFICDIVFVVLSEKLYPWLVCFFKFDLRGKSPSLSYYGVTDAMSLNVFSRDVTTIMFRAQINKLIRLTDDTYTYDQVIKMELVVLRVLNFRLARPTPTVFLDRVLASHEHNKKVRVWRHARLQLASTFECEQYSL